jgi:hypothetical protein
MHLYLGKTTLVRGMPLLCACTGEQVGRTKLAAEWEPELFLSGVRVRHLASHRESFAHDKASAIIEADSAQLEPGNYRLELRYRDDEPSELSEELWILTEDQYLSFYKEIYEEDFDDEVRLVGEDFEDLSKFVWQRHPVLIPNSTPHQSSVRPIHFRGDWTQGNASRSRVIFAFDAVMEDLAYVAPYLGAAHDKSHPLTEPSLTIQFDLDPSGRVSIDADLRLIYLPSENLAESFSKYADVSMMNILGRGTFSVEAKMISGDPHLHLRVFVEPERLFAGRKFTPFQPKRPRFENPPETMGA